MLLSPIGQARAEELESASGAGRPRAVGSDAGSEESPDETAQRNAQELFRRGLAAYRDGRHVEAIDFLFEAHQLLPLPAFLYNIALAYEALGDHSSALRWLRTYRAQTDDAAVAQEVEEKIRRHETALSQRGIQQVQVTSAPAGAVILVDGRPRGLTPNAFEVVPGAHRVVLKLDGHETYSGQFVLRPERAQDVHVELAPLSVEPVAEAAPVGTTESLPQTEPGASAAGGLSQLRPWTWALAGASVAAFGSALTLELLRRDREDVARAASQRDYASAYDDMARKQAWARALLGVGAGCAVALGVSLYFDVPRAREGHLAVGACGDGLCVRGGAAF